MVSTNSRGGYYRKKSEDYYRDLGYMVQTTEFICGRPISKDKIIYVKKDVFGSDFIAMNRNEIIFVNSKHTITGNTSVEKSRGKKEFEKYPFPPHVKLQLIIWQPRVKVPLIVEL